MQIDILVTNNDTFLNLLTLRNRLAWLITKDLQQYRDDIKLLDNKFTNHCTKIFI